MSHEPRLTGELRVLLSTQRVAALGTTTDEGAPFVSMVPFAIERTSGCLVIHVSVLAAHTHNLQVRECVSLLVTVPERQDLPVHDLHRVTMQGRARMLERGGTDWRICKGAYLERFPDVEFMTELGGFTFVAIDIFGARHVSGFGAARSVDQDEVELVLGPQPAAPAEI
jgi:putative heme iron utilization protein